MKMYYGKVLTVVFGCLFAAGCNDLAQVRDFAAISSQPEVYNGLVNEYVQSSDRQKLYMSESKYKAIDLETEERRKQAARLMERQKVLTQYMSMLAKVAADDLPDKVTGSTGKLVTGVKGMDTGLNSSSLDLVGSLVKLTARTAVDGYRQEQLSQIIVASDKSLGIVVDSMSSSAEIIKASLERERAMMGSAYSRALGDATGAESLNLKRRWYDENKKNQERQAACDSYVKALAKIKQGHKKLKENATTMSRKDLSNLISSYKDDVKSLYNEAKKLL